MKLGALYDLQMTCRLRPRVCDDYNLLVKTGKTKNWFTIRTRYLMNYSLYCRYGSKTVVPNGGSRKKLAPMDTPTRLMGLGPLWVCPQASHPLAVAPSLPPLAWEPPGLLHHWAATWRQQQRVLENPSRALAAL